MGKKETTLTQEEKEFFMREAIAEAKKAEGLAEVPIGAVIVRQGEIIGHGRNFERSGARRRGIWRYIQSSKGVVGG